MDDNFLQIDQALNDALAQFGSVQIRKAMREVAQYLRRQNRFRIRAQQNYDGSRYEPRKQPQSDLRRVSFKYRGKKRIIYVRKETSEYIQGSFDGENTFNFSKADITELSRVKRKTGKMLLGLAKRMRATWSLDSAVVSANGRIASIHHYGEEEKGIQYAARTLVGLPEKDKQEVLNILLKNLELDKI